ncbi:PepSY-associated TM helix domain-containing protein [Methylobacterium durans]|uniref:PepSY-associated TM helix domain-containing protein n=1 Tax=Methylobacterium durans TaxID=2202825 RepID=UPI002AFF055A|nr:PepSY-associated TM helix domain-containing protein [Methylobacterium durans]MEA1831931.1 PepSY-associated TM helix domain-containing protein [Methylobacterium durans]
MTGRESPWGRLRAAWKRLHRWFGLGGGALLVLIGLTGSLNVFYREIDAALNPALYRPASPERRIGPSEALAAAAQADRKPVSQIAPPDGVWPVWVIVHAHPDRRIWTTMIDPSDGRVLGRRDTGTAFAHLVYRLHYTLLLRDWWGKEAVGVAGIGLLLSCLSGLWLWWPRPGRFRRSVTLRRGVSRQRFWLDLHGAAGFWACAVLVIVAVTGIGHIFPGLMRPVVGAFSPVTALPSPSMPASDAPRLGADAILAAVQSAHPEAAVTRINPPSGSRNTWRVFLAPPGVDPAFRSDGVLWLDPWSGRIVEDRSWGAMSNGNRYQALQIWLHNGSLAGLPGRLLVFAAGFAPLLLFASGFAVWRSRRARLRALAPA